MKHVNLALRLLMEVAAIITFGVWGYSLSGSGIRIILAVFFPLLFATLWGVFAVKDDPSRSGKTVVSTPGVIRLFLELALFAAATWMLFNLGYTTSGWVLGGAVVLHYIISFDRIAWLLKQK
ncbi:MAG: YrdB family protein [Bacteroidetes bacterium]|nr:YrdB family protein [Bacteroidota bacterium]